MPTPIPEDESGTRVCLASLRFHPDYAGPALRFRRYAPGLVARGVAMNVFSGSWPEVDAAGVARHDGIADGALLLPERVDSIPVQRVRLPAGASRRRMYLTYERALARYCLDTRPDVIQLLSPTTTLIPRLARFRAAGIPLVYTHTMLDEADGSLRGRLRALHRTLPFRFMDCIVVSSGVMRDALRQDGVRGRIEVIPNGLDLKRFRPADSAAARAALRVRLGLPAEGELIVFVGGFLQHRKGIDVLADAWKLMARTRPGARLVLVGPTRNDLRPSDTQSEFLAGVMASLEASGALERVIFTGAVEEVEAYLQAADLFVFPSRKEGMPNVVAEAFGCGAAAILAPFLGLPAEFGRPDHEFLLTAREPGALAEAMTHLLDRPAERERLAKSALAWARNHLDLERSLDRYAELYRELAARRGTRHTEWQEGAGTRRRRGALGPGGRLRATG